MQQAQLELGLIRQEMGEHLPMTAEIQPMFRDGGVLFMLSPNEALWLGVDGSALKDHVAHGFHRVEIFRGGLLISAHELPSPPAFMSYTVRLTGGPDRDATYSQSTQPPAVIFAQQVLTRSWDATTGRFTETTRGYFYERRNYGGQVTHFDFVGFLEEVFMDSKDADRASSLFTLEAIGQPSVLGSFPFPGSQDDRQARRSTRAKPNQAKFEAKVRSHRGVSYEEPVSGHER